MTGLTIPELGPDVDMLATALAYARAGWYVVPIKAGTKHPGSILGRQWHHQSSRDPQMITAWLAGTSHGIALHLGRSGALAFDVDRPENIPHPLKVILGKTGSLDDEPLCPFQATRTDTPVRGHYLFAQPPGRMLGNGTGRLGGEWGEIRGCNGVIVVAPTAHPEDGGRYHWITTGALPVLPSLVAGLLDDAGAELDAATDTQVVEFLATPTGNERPELLAGWLTTFATKVAAGESRHARMVAVCAGAMREARAGFYDPAIAAQKLRAAFLTALAQPGIGQQGKARSGARAGSEWSGILAWAVAQAIASDPAATRARIEERMPDNPLTLAPSPKAGEGVVDAPHTTAQHERRLRLTPASEIPMRAVRWLWEEDGHTWIPLGELTLVGGREGIGKSTICYDLAAKVSRGTLPGDHEGDPRDVVIYATEDDWSATIVPRLVAHDADLTRIFRLDAYTIGANTDEPISLPRDTSELADLCKTRDVGLILFDPLMSVVRSALDTHKDAEVREALEPVVRIAHAAGAAVLALIHVNKSKGVDTLTSITGSRAFTAVARAVLYAIAFEADDGTDRTIIGQAKTNLGPVVKVSLEYRVIGVKVGDDHGRPITAGRIEWLGETDLTVAEVRSGDGDAEVLTAVQAAADWLTDHLTQNGGTDDSASIRAAAAKQGHSESSLQRARRKIKATSTSHGFPRRSFWTLPGTAALTLQESAGKESA